MKAVSKWLNLPDFNASLPPTEYKMWVTKVVWNLSTATGLMRKNLLLQNDIFVRVPAGFNACVYGPGSDGIECGEPFFTAKGPKCRRDVLTHGVFHLFRVGCPRHAGSLSPEYSKFPTKFPRIRTIVLLNAVIASF